MVVILADTVDIQPNCKDLHLSEQENADRDFLEWAAWRCARRHVYILNFLYVIYTDQQGDVHHIMQFASFISTKYYGSAFFFIGEFNGI